MSEKPDKPGASKATEGSGPESGPTAAEGKGAGRRNFKLGSDASVDASRPVRPRAVADVLRLDHGDEVPLDPAGQPSARLYDPQRFEDFVRGRITLAELEGITKQEQYQIAELGHHHLAQSRLDQAKAVFEGLLALDPYDAYFHMALASVAQQQGQLEAAEAGYTRALTFNPFSATAHANRGEARVLQGRMEEGSADLVKACQLDPAGREPATLRARATLQVLNEQLSALDQEELRRRAAEQAAYKAAQEAAERAAREKVQREAAKKAAAIKARGAKAPARSGSTESGGPELVMPSRRPRPQPRSGGKPGGRTRR
jgi:Tfp pilus assembly protein PilF